MSKHNRTEVVRVLREQMEATKDPQTKVDLAKQLAKLLPKPRQVRRPRKVEATPTKVKKASLLTKVHGSAVDQLSPIRKLIHFCVLEFEKRKAEHKKRTGQELTEAEKKALVREAALFVHAQLTAEDHALLVAEDAENNRSQEVA